MSQSDLILAALQRGPLTKAEAFQLGGGLSLNSRIADLRKLGYVIECKRVTRGSRAVWEYRLEGPAQMALFTDAGSGVVLPPQKDESPLRGSLSGA